MGWSLDVSREGIIGIIMEGASIISISIGMYWDVLWSLDVWLVVEPDPSEKYEIQLGLLFMYSNVRIKRGI